jgi:hypothetical protein
MAEQERFAQGDDPPDISDVMAARVQEIRKHLPGSCEIAAAIDRVASWSKPSMMGRLYISMTFCGFVTL